jgi:regulator of protease activity HflC (stomatin/prohibitin superfamily)
VVKIDGEIQALLPPGLTAYWKINHLVEAEVVDTRLQVVEVSGQEILTKDKVNLRLNLAANWRYSDVLQACGQLTKPLEHLYRELQFALRERSAPARSMSYWKISRSLMRWSANRCKAACHPLEWKLRRLG